MPISISYLYLPYVGNTDRYVGTLSKLVDIVGIMYLNTYAFCFYVLYIVSKLFR